MNILKSLLIGSLAILSAAVFASVDVNKATQAELESIKGIGPSVSARIMDARKTGAFKDWGDLSQRVKGVGDRSAAKFSAQGMTVNGAAFEGATLASAPNDKLTKANAKTPTK